MCRTARKLQKIQINNETEDDTSQDLMKLVIYSNNKALTNSTLSGKAFICFAMILFTLCPRQPEMFSFSIYILHRNHYGNWYLFIFVEYKFRIDS